MLTVVDSALANIPTAKDQLKNYSGAFLLSDDLFHTALNSITKTKSLDAVPPIHSFISSFGAVLLIFISQRLETVSLFLETVSKALFIHGLAEASDKLKVWLYILISSLHTITSCQSHYLLPSFSFPSFLFFYINRLPQKPGWKKHKNRFKSHWQTFNKSLLLSSKSLPATSTQCEQVSTQPRQQSILFFVLFFVFLFYIYFAL